VDWLRTEFSTSASIAGATPDKLAGMAEGELGKLLPQAPLVPVLAGAVVSASGIADASASGITQGIEGLRGKLQAGRMVGAA
jgi:hypothetical protein